MLFLLTSLSGTETIVVAPSSSASESFFYSHPYQGRKQQRKRQSFTKHFSFSTHIPIRDGNKAELGEHVPSRNFFYSHPYQGRKQLIGASRRNLGFRLFLLTSLSGTETSHVNLTEDATEAFSTHIPIRDGNLLQFQLSSRRKILLFLLTSLSGTETS